MRHRADAAAQLNRVFGRRDDRLDRRTIDAFALERAVQIDHMQPLKALFFERFGLGGRVVIVDGGLTHIAQLETHALSIFEIDSGEQDFRFGHGAQVRKLPIRARPSVWLFSGWNCVPALLSCATSAVTGPP